ncbi:MAG: zinc-binding dehydrogenase [Verrucomicrobia bacterium]|nr:zinc-binding dehydrogenase [Verrucomicrobiota bacterium]
MWAAQLITPRKFRITSLPLPVPNRAQVRIKIDYCGICSSNLGPWKGAPWFSYPFEPGAPGHEAVGTVDAVGQDVSDALVGQKVAMLSSHGFAEYDLAGANAFVALQDLSVEQIFLGEPLGCAINVFRRSGVKQKDWVAIVGIGFLGAILLQLCLDQGARVLCFSRRQFARDLALRLGASFAASVNSPQNLLDDVARLTEGKLCDVVFEAGGAQLTLDIASQLVKERGRLIIAGYHQDGGRTVNMQQWNWRGLDVINAHEREEAVYIAGIHAAAAAVQKGLIQLNGLITNIFPLNRIEEGFELADSRPEGFLKAIVQFAADPMVLNAL